MTIWGEHRYFGKSMPYGDDSFKKENLDMLTVEAAMNDYVDLIKTIKETEGLQDRAVIVGGGSYGGMLSAWLRMKYPQWFQGALAASAPILFFDGYVTPDAYDIIATGSYAASSKGETDCSDLISDGFDALDALR